MRKVIFVGCGSAVGAILRYMIRDVSVIGNIWNIPTNTLLINAVGALLIAFVSVLNARIWQFDQDIRLGITAGLLGGFTTFSLMCRECAEMIGSGMYLTVAVYMTASVVCGLVGVMIGELSAERLATAIEDEEEGVLEESDVI